MSAPDRTTILEAADEPEPGHLIDACAAALSSPATASATAPPFRIDEQD